MLYFCIKLTISSLSEKMKLKNRALFLYPFNQLQFGGENKAQKSCFIFLLS